MILIDAVFVNNGGGKVLLDYLIKNIEDSRIDAFYLLDKRNSDDPKFKTLKNKSFIKGSLFSRYLFYHTNKIIFNKIICFGNMPPLKKMNAIVYTYFHQKLFLDIPSELNLNFKIQLYLKSLVVKYLKKNTNFWMVQTSLVKKQILTKYNLKENTVLELPFYNPLANLNSSIQVKENIFLYVSLATSHKNHLRLIEAFESFYKKYKFGELWLTVFDNTELSNLIQEKHKNNIPIINLYKIEGKELENAYSKSKFVIFPSLSESFGLGLIEGITFNCNIIGSDLPYTYEICDPSIIFDPYDSKSIESSFVKAMKSDYPSTVPTVSNKINDILKMLNND